MTPCSLLDDDDITNNILLDLSVKANEEGIEEEKEDVEEEKEEKEDVEEVEEKSNKEDVEEVEEKSNKEDVKEEEYIQEEVKENLFVNSFNKIVKLFIKCINDIAKAGAEPLYNDKLYNDDKL